MIVVSQASAVFWVYLHTQRSEEELAEKAAAASQERVPLQPGNCNYLLGIVVCRAAQDKNLRLARLVAQ